MPPLRPPLTRLARGLGATVVAVALAACASAPRGDADARTARVLVANLGAQVWRLELTRLDGAPAGPANPDRFSWEVAPHARQSVQVLPGEYRVRRVAPGATNRASGERVTLRAGETYAWTLGAPSDVDAKTPAP